MKVPTVKTVLIVMALLPCVSAQDITVENTSAPLGNGRWEWTVYIEAPPVILDRVKCVEYILHPTFPNPFQVVCERGQQLPFALHGNAWGEFNVVVKVNFTDRNKQSYNHWLKLTSSAAPKPKKKPLRKKRLTPPLPHQQG